MSSIRTRSGAPLPPRFPAATCASLRLRADRAEAPPTVPGPCVRAAKRNDILAGYSIPEEAPGFDFNYDGEAFFMEQIWPRLVQCSSIFERCKHVRGWSGLYAVTPDRSGIAGPIGAFTNLFEAHSFTGRGVMQSYGIATALAEWIDLGSPSRAIAPLPRDRFSDPDKWLVEDLHI